jgi:hypothetical protein
LIPTLEQQKCKLSKIKMLQLLTKKLLGLIKSNVQSLNLPTNKQNHSKPTQISRLELGAQLLKSVFKPKTARSWRREKSNSSQVVRLTTVSKDGCSTHQWRKPLNSCFVKVLLTSKRHMVITMWLDGKWDRPSKWRSRPSQEHMTLHPLLVLNYS